MLLFFTFALRSSPDSKVGVSVSAKKEHNLTARKYQNDGG